MLVAYNKEIIMIINSAELLGEVKRCITCDQQKALDQFKSRKVISQVGGVRLKNECTACCNIYQRDWKRANGQYKKKIKSAESKPSYDKSYADVLLNMGKIAHVK